MDQTYSIDTILNMRNIHREAPYPGFNLFDICRKKSAAGQQRLKPGENAWTAQKPKTADQVLIKTTRGLLNKLTPEKYNEVVEETEMSMLLEDTAIETVIDLIFEKALLEPAYSKTYAQFCHDVALHEVNNTPSSAPDQGEGQQQRGRRSEFRNKIVSRAQREFEKKDEVDPELEDEARDFALTALAKKKKANIKFVGQLYMQKVISQRTMHAIIRGIFEKNDRKPKEIDIEVLAELLETIGKTMDESGNENRCAMDDHFMELDDLLRRIDKKQVPCGARVRFRIMDTLDLRENAWVPRVHSKSSLTPATFSEKERQLTTPTLAMGMKSPTASTPNRRGAPRFPESPSAGGEPAWRGGKMPSSVTSANLPSFPNTPSGGGLGNRAASSTSPQPSGSAAAGGGGGSSSASILGGGVSSSGATSSANAKKNAQKLSEKIHAGRREWKDNGQQLDFSEYETAICGFPGIDEENVKDTIAIEIIKEACTTSRPDAQEDACQFLVTGLKIGKIPLLTAFSSVIHKAIEDDVPSDVPRFYSRIVKIITTCAGSTEPLDSYRDTIIATYTAFDKLKDSIPSASGSTPVSGSPNQPGAPGGFPGTATASSTSSLGIPQFDPMEDYIEGLLSIWRLIPNGSGVDSGKLVSAIFDSRDSGNTSLIVALLDHLVSSDICKKEDVKAWVDSPAANASADLKTALTEKFEEF